MPESEQYTLDSSAILTYLEDEAGAEIIGDALKLARKGTVQITICFISMAEIEYIARRELGQAKADFYLGIIQSWPVRIIQSSLELCRSAARLKADYPISLADAFIAACSLAQESVLIHKDPEFDSLPESVQRQALPHRS